MRNSQNQVSRRKGKDYTRKKRKGELINAES